VITLKTKLGTESFVKVQSLTTKLITMYPALKRYCQSLTRNDWDAEDLAHETIEKMYKTYINKNDNNNKITHALLYKIAHNHWVDQVRKRSRENGMASIEVSIEPMKTLPEMYSIAEILVEHLTPQQTVIFILKDVFQYGISEIAEEINVSEGAIKASLFRARNHIKKVTSQEDIADKRDGNKVVEKRILFLDTVIKSVQNDQPFLLIKLYKKLYNKNIPMCIGPSSLQLRAA
jgi:RNA polymerase sigma-70 factor, ECF subfamily